jgi:hypothetical protein
MCKMCVNNKKFTLIKLTWSEVMPLLLHFIFQYLRIFNLNHIYTNCYFIINKKNI